jgi:hypothetical protein
MEASQKSMSDVEGNPVWKGREGGREEGREDGRKEGN